MSLIIVNRTNINNFHFEVKKKDVVIPFLFPFFEKRCDNSRRLMIIYTMFFVFLLASKSKLFLYLYRAPTDRKGHLLVFYTS
jgi:hypothetical protein